MKENRFISFALSASFLILYIGNLFAQENSWTRPITLNDKAFYAKHVTTAVDSVGRIYVVWSSVNQPPSEMNAQLIMAMFDGHSWSPPQAISDTGQVDWTPDMALDTSGHPHVVWGEFGSGEIFYEGFDGVAWSRPINISQTSGASFYPRIAIDHMNRIHVVWHDDSQGGFSVYYASFNGTVWSTPVNLSDTLNTAGFPRIAIDSRNRVHLAYIMDQPPFYNTDVFCRTWDQAAWSDAVPVFIDTLRANPPEIAVGPDDLSAVVWSNHTAIYDPPTLELSYSDFQNGSWSDRRVISDSLQPDWPSLAIDVSKQRHVVWQDWRPDNRTQKIMYSSSSTGLVWSRPIDLTQGTGGAVSFQPKVRADNRGLIHVVWLSNDYGVYYTRLDPTIQSVNSNGHESEFQWSLGQNYPNPFNPTTTIRYSLPVRSHVVLRVFDPLGRAVATLVNEDVREGYHEVRFDGSGLASGMYLARLQVNDDQGRVRYTRTNRLLLMK